MSKLSVNELTDETGSGAPSFPNGMSVTGAALTDPEITGGIFLGGTGAANKLDDYEEGTWTPSVEGRNSAGSATYQIRDGSYTKIGNVVHFTCNVLPTSQTGESGELQIAGLPFTARGGRGYAPLGTYVVNYSGYTFSVSAYVQTAETNIRFRDIPDSTADDNYEIRVAGTYTANS